MQGSDGHRELGKREGPGTRISTLRALGLLLLAGLVVLVACRSQSPTATPGASEASSPVPTSTTGPGAASPAESGGQATATPGEPPPAALGEAPALVSPANGANVEGAVELAWQWTGQLQADQYYEVRVWAQGQAPEAVAWQKETTLADVRVPEGSYEWSVLVVREAGAGQDGSKKWEAVSQESPAWAFTLAAAASGNEQAPPAGPTEALSGGTSVSGGASVSDSTSLRHGPGGLQVAKVGGMLGLGLIAGLWLVPAKPGWLRIRRRRR